jgi:hypothetical protein
MPFKQATTNGNQEENFLSIYFQALQNDIMIDMTDMFSLCKHAGMTGITRQNLPVAVRKWV